MIEMALSSRHRIQNPSPGGLRPSTLPLGHGGSPQYLSDTGSGIELKSDQENNVRIVCCQDRKRPTSKTLLPYIMHTLIFMC